MINANRPHGHGNLDLKKFSPFQKNPAISQVFREIGLADELGSGMRNSYKFTKLYSGGEPTFTEDGDLFRIIIPLSAAATVSAKPQKEEKKKKEETIATNGTIIKLSQSEIIRIVNFCGEPRTKAEIMEFVGAKSAEYFRKTTLKPLVDAEYLLMTEPPRSSKQKYIGFNQRSSN